MNRKLVIIVLLTLPLIAVLVVSCGQQPAQLSPEDQARQTVTDFLEMCKQGQVQDAINKYVDANADLSPHDAELLQTIGDYGIGNITSDPPYIKVTLDVSPDWEGNMTGAKPALLCSQDGTQIFGLTLFRY
jgi:hypothetical protein